jgi:hypothetical protein
MRCRYLVPTLGLLTCVGSAAAVDLGAGVSLDAYVDTWLSITDVDDAEDVDIDFTAEAHTDISWAIGDSVTAEFHAFYNEGGASLETGIVSWAINDQFSVVMGQYINVLGWEAAHAPDRYRFDRSILVNNGSLNFYGAATNQGVGIVAAASEMIVVQAYIQDNVFGEAAGRATDAIGFIGDVMIDIEGYGNVNLELVYDMENAPLFGGDVEEDVVQFGVNTTYNAVEKLTIGAELFYHDYDLAGGLGAMVLGNYQFADNASGTAWLAYGDPVDDDDIAEDDEIIEFGVAVLTNPTNDPNFALNFELKIIEADDANPTTVSEVVGVIEMLAIVP